MVGIWGVKLASHFIDDKISKIAAKEWSESISDLSAEQIKKAIDYCKITYEWPPSIHQFRKAALGIPSEEEAWSLVQHCNSMPEDAFLRACYSSIDWYRCKHFMSAQEARIEFRGIYEVALSKFMRIKNV